MSDGTIFVIGLGAGSLAATFAFCLAVCMLCDAWRNRR